MMPSRREETLAALEANGWSLKAAALDLGLSYAALNGRVRRDNALRAAWEAHFVLGGTGRRARGLALTEDAVCDALRAHDGVMRRAARALGCSDESVRIWANRSARVALLCKARRERVMGRCA